MKRPDLDNVRELLRAKNYEAVAEIEPQIIEYCKQKLNNCINSIELMQTLLLTLESQYSEKEKDSTNPLPDYLLGLTNRLISEYELLRIDDYQSLQANDVTLYYWKHKKKLNVNPVIINKVIEGSKVHIRYTHHEPPNGFEHTFKANNFKFAIRQLASSAKVKVNTKSTFFFFNS